MNFTIKNKLILLGAVSVGALCISGVITYLSNQELIAANLSLEQMSNANDLNTNMRTKRLQLLLSRYEAIYNYSLNGKVPDDITQTLTESREGLQESLHKITEMQADYLPKELLEQAKQEIAGMLALSVSDLVAKGATLQEISQQVEDSNVHRAKLKAILVDIDKRIGDKFDETQLSVTKTIDHASLLLTVSVIASLSILIVFLTLIIRSITRPMKASTQISADLAQGNYKMDIAGLDKQDELGALSRALNEIKTTVADYSGQLSAISKAQAVIEFTMDGNVVTANDNFLSTMGYTFDEIKGKHHSLFVDPAYKNSTEYAQFWDNLKRGQYQAGEFKRIAKGGREIWLQASYNPIFDPNGKAFKVVKYATDVTQMVTMRTENEIGMNEAVKVLTEMASGNLTQIMQEDYTGTFGDIKQAMNATIDKLTETVIRIKEASQSVSSASGEISAGSADLSQRTEEQASSLEETAASMEELTGTVKQNSENAEQAAKTSAKARDFADKGGEIVRKAVAAMTEIESSSKKVSDIIGVIDEIAFQTNLLALNAAVEAARAGDAGKGFAVVASEVRSLAGRSAMASKEIKNLIIESGNQVQEGAKLVNAAGSSLEDIVTANNEVNNLVSSIANATREQSVGIGEVNTAITQMDEVTQQNAALVEENTAAAQSLVDQAHQLDGLVSFFQIEEGAEGNVHQMGASAAPARAGTTQNLPAKSAKSSSVIKKTSSVKKKPPVMPARQAAVANGTTNYTEGWEEF